ncbi:hypothetical protein TrRE_jg9950 [Triparma retinervis]|uniref:NADP-dependent 3-hydroxy acid dehydrogenase YdfG n=1 Tax=Triparma retinervis TaxID=2557542 RepID=A0A9W7L294_9STRA|nr:hypothetical protein TrRE_jg9950 [Triparma retinervis]
MSCSGRVACVTGSSSGIGSAIATSLALAGCSVALAARRLEVLEKLKSDLVAKGVSPDKIICCKTDVAVRQSVIDLITSAESSLGPVDILVNCAGVMYFTLMKNCNMDEWDRTIDTNIKGVTNGFGAVLPGFLQRKRGHIVTISSDAGRRIFPSLAVYCASKTFVEVLSEGTRREVVGTGVKITTIQPGDVGGTELIMKNSDKEAADKMGVTIGAPVGEGFNRNQLLDTQDVADAVIYAVTAPPHVAVNEILIEPRDQE